MNRKLIYALLLIVVVCTAPGCRSIRKRTQHDDVRTGMFGDNRTNLLTKFKEIRPKVTTTNDLVKMGFDLSAKNVRKISGVAAFREVFGQDVFRDSGDVGKITSSFEELNRYTLIQIPYKNVTVVSDRIYWSKKVTTEQGFDDMYSIVFRDGIVVYAADRLSALDTFRRDKAFARGPIELFGEVGGAAGAAYNAVK